MVPIVEPITRNCWKNTRFNSAGGLKPLVAPAHTMVPPGRSERSECAQVASPTVSITASTRSGNRAPGSNASSAPRPRAAARFASEVPVTHTRSPSAAPRAVAADATPPDAPCTSTVSPALSPESRVSIR